jgi:cell division protein FtsB
MEERNIGKKILKFLFNKYSITIYLFLVVYLLSDNSPLKYREREEEKKALQQETKKIKQECKKTESLIKSLDQKDSLERYAREHYNMHAEGETVYIVEMDSTDSSEQ